MSHLDTFNTEERYALEAVCKLHTTLRETAGTKRGFRASSPEEMLEYIETVAGCMARIEADERLLIELGRRQTLGLSVTAPAHVSGAVSEQELLAFYHDTENLRAAAALVLHEVSVNLSTWQAQSDALIEARHSPPN